MNKILIAVVGPTAIGKTKLAIALAQYFNTEILSADSRQFFKEMNIGTAVPSKEELNAAVHHFVQHKSIFDAYSVGDFERDAIALLNRLFKTKDIIVMVGGSGLYVDAVVNGLDDFPDVDSNIREVLIQKKETEGLQALQDELKKLDPEYYERVDLENPHRLIRALEICLATGRPYSSFLKKKNAQRTFKTLYVGIEAPRETIYDRINRRVDFMMEIGLLQEAKALHKHKTLNTLQTVGYKELFAYCDGACAIETAVAEIKKNTRRFAKRQLTWYRKNENILWIDYEESEQNVYSTIEEKIKTITYG